MYKKKSKDVRRSQSKRKNSVNKNTCTICPIKLGLTVHIHEALQRKYSSNHLSSFLKIQKQIQKQKRDKPETMNPRQEYLDKFYRPTQRKHQFFKIKQIYQLHKQAPKIYVPQIIQILNKRHYRKRLLQYFKIAKVLGLKVSGAKTSTFLYSLSKTFKPQEFKGSYQKILGQISTYQFSEQLQRQLLQSLEKGQLQSKELNPQNNYYHKKSSLKVEKYKL